MSQSNFSNPPYSILKNEFKNIMQKNISEHKELKIGAFSDKSEILNLLGKINGWEQCLELFNKFCSMIENSQNQPQPQATQSNPSNPTNEVDPQEKTTTPVIDGEIIEG